MNNVTRRRANGKRIEGRSLAIQTSLEIVGMLLSHAYMVIKSAGFQLRINKLDGVNRETIASFENKEIVSVDVVDGSVRKSWVD